jgi:hypothetical protein
MTDNNAAGSGSPDRTTVSNEPDFQKRGYLPPPSPVAASDRRPASQPSTPRQPVAPTPTAPRPTLPRPDGQSGYVPPKRPAPKPPDVKT